MLVVTLKDIMECVFIVTFLCVGLGYLCFMKIADWVHGYKHKKNID